MNRKALMRSLTRDDKEYLKREKRAIWRSKWVFKTKWGLKNKPKENANEVDTSDDTTAGDTEHCRDGGDRDRDE